MYNCVMLFWNCYSILSSCTTFIAAVAIHSWKMYWIRKLGTCCVLLLRTGNDVGSVEDDAD
jgi:hypothetical protein